MPFVTNYLDPEFAHDCCLFLTKHGLIRCKDIISKQQASKLKTSVFNLSFENPVGIAAGFDKNSIAAPGLIHYGLGFAEVGTVTPKPQEGNPKQRIFRLVEERALINRCGFNNKGLEFVKKQLNKRSSLHPLILGLNLGKNKNTKDQTTDYLYGLENGASIKSVDYLVINISSPNTPGLRDIQDKKNLERLLDDVLRKMKSLDISKPLLIKISPDVSNSQLKDIADVILSKRCGEKKVDGVILTNTTITRPIADTKKTEQLLTEAGGLSGAPLRDRSRQIISEFYKLTGGKVPIIGVGGISSGQDAYDKIKAGASLVQLYTSITFDGPPVVNRIKRELVELLERDKFNSISEAVGHDHKR